MKGIRDYIFGPDQAVSTGNEFKHKIFVVGDAETGKKSFIAGFDNEYSTGPISTLLEEVLQKGGYPNTIGIDFVTKTKKIGDDTYKFQFYDLAGHKKFRTITKSYYNKVTGIFVMVDATKPSTLTAAKLWKENINENFIIPNFSSSTIPIILLINKIDLLDEKQKSELNYNNFCKLYGFDSWIPISNETGENIELAHNTMIDICKSLVNFC